QYAHSARQPIPALVSLDLEADRRNAGLDPSGLYLPRHCLALGDRAAALYRISDGAARADRVRPDVRGARNASVLADQAARKFRGHYELRHFSDVLRVLRALPALEGAGIERTSVPDLQAQPFHLRCRIDPLCALRKV